MLETLEMIVGTSLDANGSSPWLESTIFFTGTCLSSMLRHPIKLTTYQHKTSDGSVRV